MFTTSFKSLRRLSGHVVTLLLSAGCLFAGAAAQAPQVVSSSLVAVPHNETYGAPWQSSVTNGGDFVLFDFKTGGFYQYPANGGAEITVGAPNQFAGGFTDSGIAIDPRNNNLILNNNYNGGLMFFPFDAKTGTWDIAPKTVASGLAGNLGGSCGNYFQSAGMAMNDNGILAVATENGCGVEIFTVPVDINGNFGSATPIVSNMKARAKTVAIDDTGNIYWNEDAGGLAGVLFLPAGTTGLTSETTVQRVDPSLTNVQGVTNDKAGNIYITDGTAGEYMVPLVAGIPAPAQAVLLNSFSASGGPAFDPLHQTLFLPINSGNGFKDLVKVLINRTEFGSSPVGTAPANSVNVTYYFSGAATPYNFVLQQDGTTTPFTLGALSGCGITPANGTTPEKTTTYAAGGTCALPVSYTPSVAGDQTATLLMLDAMGNILNTTVLHGVGQASALVATPGTQTTFGAGLKTPSQMATDAAGNLYIADAGLGKVLEYANAAGSTATSAPTSIGTGLTQPTGVAVDGAGDVFIADSGTGSVVEVPYGTTSLNAAGQFTVKSGLGTNLKLAIGSSGVLFVADPSNARVVALKNLLVGTDETDIPFATPTAIAADGEGDLFVANGADLVEVSTYNVQTTLLTNLSGTTGLAVDPSGAVYIASNTGTVRVPDAAGAYSAGGSIAIASAVTNAAAVALDPAGNAFVADGTVLDVALVTPNAFFNLGTLPTISSTQQAVATLFNSGNLPLNITAFGNTPDYSVTSNTCIGTPVAIGNNCFATITFNPGPGDQGTLTGSLAITSDAFDSSVVLNVTGVGAALSKSSTAIKVTNPTVTNAPVVVTVTPASGTSPTPTGNVTLIVTSSDKATHTQTMALTNGTVTFSAADIQAGAASFTANYLGDRIYGTSTASTTATIAAGIVSLTQPALSAVPTYVLSQGQGSAAVYNGGTAYEYVYPLVVKSADGSPLIGVPIYSGKTQTGVDYGTVTYEVSGGATACPGTSSTIPVNGDGTAPLNTSCLSINTSNDQIPNLTATYTITPVYTGNSASDYASVTGTPFTVIAVAYPMTILTSSPGSLSVAAGSSTSANITLASILGYGVADALENEHNYTLPLELECDGLPAHTSCTFTYPNPDPSDANSTPVTPTTPGTAVLTLNTNVPVGTVTNASIARTSAIFASLFGVGLLGLAFGRKKTQLAGVLRVFCLLALTGTAVTGLSSCSTKNISATPVLTTPAGTYTITVTAKQVGSRVVTINNEPQTVYGSNLQENIPFTMQVTVH